MPKGITKKMYDAGKKAEKSTPVSKRSLVQRKKAKAAADKWGKSMRKELFGTPSEIAKRTAKKKARKAIATRRAK